MDFRSEKELIDFGKSLGKKIKKNFLKDDRAVIIELIGDVGAGKTTLTRGIADGLGVKEPVTSPSFTISKHYAFPLENDSMGVSDGGELVHYDFYRLPEPGLMADDLEDAMRSKNTVVVIEWGESVADVLPEDHIIYNILLNDDDSRTVTRLNNDYGRTNSGGVGVDVGVDVGTDGEYAKETQ